MNSHTTWSIIIFGEFWVAFSAIATFLAVVVALWQVYDNKKERRRLETSAAAITILAFLKSEERKLDTMGMNLGLVREMFLNGSLNMSYLNTNNIEATSLMEQYYPEMYEEFEEYIATNQRFVMFCIDFFHNMNEQQVNNKQPLLVKLSFSPNEHELYEEKLDLSKGCLSALRNKILKQLKQN